MSAGGLPAAVPLAYEVSGGRSYAGITRRRVDSEKNVRHHVSRVLAKLDIPDRARAIVLARDAGLGTGPLHGH